jgi:hypothetical protein
LLVVSSAMGAFFVQRNRLAVYFTASQARNSRREHGLPAQPPKRGRKSAGT